MPVRSSIPAGTELRVALPLCVKRRSDGSNLWLAFGDRLVIDTDGGNRLDGRMLSGLKVAITLVNADLARLTFDDGSAILPGGATLTPLQQAAAPATAPAAAYQPAPALSAEAGYLKGRPLLDFWDMPR